ncbi:MAG: cytochrome c [Parvibaculaceae bacterium]
MQAEKQTGRTRLRKFGLLTGTALFFFAALIPDAGTTIDPVAQRQASMRAMAESVRTLAWMFEGRLAYGREKAVAAAKAIRDLSGERLSSEFSGATLGAPSRAKAAIAQDSNEFAALATHLQDVAAAFEQAAAAGPTNITAAMRMGSGGAMDNPLLGKRQSAAQPDLSKVPMEHLLHLMMADCGSCHARFRANEE